MRHLLDGNAGHASHAGHLRVPGHLVRYVHRLHTVRSRIRRVHVKALLITSLNAGDIACLLLRMSLVLMHVGRVLGRVPAFVSSEVIVQHVGQVHSRERSNKRVWGGCQLERHRQCSALSWVLCVTIATLNDDGLLRKYGTPWLLDWSLCGLSWLVQRSNGVA